MSKHPNTLIQHSSFPDNRINNSDKHDNRNHHSLHKTNFSNFSETAELLETRQTPVREVVIDMQDFEPHPKEKEMKVNHEILRQIQWWASLLDGVRDTDADGNIDGKGWSKHDPWSFLKCIGLAFFLVGLIPGAGFLISATLSYFKVYRPLMDKFMIDGADRVTLQRYAHQCLTTDLLIGLLLFPMAPFLRLFFCGNLRMVESARIRVMRHDEKCAKAFSKSCLGSAAMAAAAADANATVTANGSGGSLKQELTRRMATETTKKRSQEALQKLVIPPPLLAKPIIPRAVRVINFVTFPSLSPIPELPEAAEAEMGPFPNSGKQQQQQPAAATGWHYLVDSNDEALDEYFATTVVGASGADEVYSVPLPAMGAQSRRNRATEVVYRPYQMDITAEYVFTPPEVHDVEDVAEDEDVKDGSCHSGSHPASPKEKPLTAPALPRPWPIPKKKQRHMPPQYYHPKQGHLNDDYWRLSCPLLTGLEAISGSGTTSGTTTRSGSQQGGLFDSSSPDSSANSSLRSLTDLKAMALTRGCVSMSSALPVMRWRSRCVEYGGSFVGGSGSLMEYGDFETDEEMEEEELLL
ncbi:hypothetical protein BG015_006669 [Linnemannia schmuckeri]|uniref:Uncharacterized protein n=1 Tax=Linnemannia schmuckeri TaxID=64567 RepID=A0A9P5S331_9FUNG|nr:hypothetical protein BG015_006669 [Linnemannia schmuckeri]